MIKILCRFSYFVPVLGVLTFVGCPPQKKVDVPKVSPATVTNAVKETELATVTLTEDAVRRLGVEVAPVLEKQMQRTRFIGGEIITPPGQSVTVTAPWSGTLSPGNPEAPLSPGMAVKQGEIVFFIQAILSYEHKTLNDLQRVQYLQIFFEAQQQAEAAQIELSAAELEWNRARELLENKAGSQQAVDMAEAKFKLAQQTFQSAISNLDMLTRARQGIVGNLPTAPFPPEPIVAPVSGVLNQFTSVAGQTVVQGSVLFDIINTGQFWVRVPVYVGQLRDIDTEQPAIIREFGQTDISKGETVMPIIAPPSANSTAATVDLFYELKSPEAWIWPGHKVAVTLPLNSSTAYRVVPWSAVVFDIYGGGWVYEQTAPRTYVRKRVEVEFVDKTGDEALAVLRSGPGVGAEIVTVGASEIFSTEIGGFL